MGSVDVAADNHFLAFGHQGVDVLLKAIVKGHFEGEALVAHAAVGKIDVIKRKFGIGHDDGAPFVIEGVVGQACRDVQRFPFVIDGGAAVALAFGGMEKGLVAVHTRQRFGQLIFR